MENDVIKFIRQKDYTFIRNIGRGATGAAILLKDELIDQLFVCKKYQPAMGIEPAEYYSKFVNEIKMMYLLNNRNVVRIYNYYLYPKQYTGYILMEYIDGNSIGDYISKNPEKIDDIFIQTVNGFYELQENGILHRDIRDSNIMVSSEGIVKIIDFGFGKKIEFDSDYDKSISLNWWCQTPNEFNDGRYDFKTEIYFVGKLFEKLLLDNGLSNFKYSDQLKKMIAPDPENRISSFKEIFSEAILKNDMENIFEEDEIEIYRSFANGLSAIYAKIENSAKYEKDVELIISKMEECYKKNMLEQEIIDSNDLAKIFVQGAYTYYKKRTIYLSCLKNFLQLLKGASSEKRRIIMLNIENRLDAIEHYRKPEDNFTDDIPF
ncbi:Kinase domain protein [uncultured spirochete]|jgi:serine/threonine-protein kinase|uniref:Kinase domain protein n=1 Tax=uncultured spirochete TaxID=156406 RepID=A0A3P3XF53_9SPIR|nr:protein kinase family protein [Rectinema subterraneum]SLM09721.1 Kinase domain protein [uncultured spirochete]